MRLFRPVGKKELELIEQSGFKAFPPRLPDQPIFYPVVMEKYAAEIAERWNTKDSHSGYVGYVTRFEVADDFICNYKMEQAGSRYHLEYWIPSEDLAEFNENIIGPIEVIRTFKGEKYSEE